MKLVYITSRFPYPLEKGDKLRAYYHLRALAKRVDVYLLALCNRKPAESSVNKLASFCTEVHYFVEPTWKFNLRLLRPGLKPFQVKYFGSRAFGRKVRQVVERIKADHVHFHLIRTGGLLSDLHARSSMDLMDSFSLGLKNLYETKPFWKRPAYKMERWLVQSFERRCIKDFEKCFIISERDRLSIDSEDVFGIQILKNGIDTEYFSVQDGIRPLGKSFDIVFVGNLGYAPNQEAVKYILQLAKRNPEWSFGIAGARAKEVSHLVFPSNIELVGWVEDIRSAYQAGSVFLAPIFYGSGLQNKILEAMALARPCITSSFVNEALQAKVGEQLLIGDDMEAIESHIGGLLENPERRDRLAKSGADFVRKQYSWDAQTKPLIAYICKKK